jgi:hypothetical protein
MAKSNTSVETLAETHNRAEVEAEASEHASNTNEDTQARDSVIEADTSPRVYYGCPNKPPEGLESELNKMLKEELQKRNLRKRYEQERAYPSCLSQTLLRAHEGISPLHSQVIELEYSTAALTEELHKRATIIKNLEEQNRHLKAVLSEIRSRIHSARNGASSLAQEKRAEDVPSQRQENHEQSPAYSSQGKPAIQNTPAVVTVKPIRSILKTPSTSEPMSEWTNESALTAFTTFIFLVISWICSFFKPAEPREEVYFYQNQCFPKISSPDFRERVKRQIHYEQLALARKDALVSLKLPDPIEEPEQSTHSSNFATLKRAHEEEEHRWFAKKMKPMTRVSME